MLNPKLKKLDELADEIISVCQSLATDVILCYQLGIDGTNLQFWRRTYIKTLFSYIEGITFQYKRIVLEMSSLSFLTEIEFSDGEKCLLKEESYSVNNKGEISIIKSKIKTEENLLFCFNMIAKGCGSQSLINKSSKDWGNFITALKIRHRITHPKNITDIEVTDKEILIVAEVAAWFSKQTENIGELITEYGENLDNKFQGNFIKIGKMKCVS
jgi:hypothetical protein